MHPTIRDGEVVTVAPWSADRVAPGDVILCRCDRVPTAHRVIAVHPSPDGRPVLHLQGDNLCSIDRPIQADEVIGRVVSVRRDGRDHLVDAPGRLHRARRIAADWRRCRGASSGSRRSPRSSGRRSWVRARRLRRHGR